MAQPLTTPGSIGRRSPSDVLSSTSIHSSQASEPGLFGAPSSSLSSSAVLASLLAQSSRHLFGPTSQPVVPPKQQVVSISALTAKLHYLKPDELALVKKAFQFADSAHLGQYRQSGEPVGV